MDSLHEAFIYTLEPCEACFIMDARTLLNVFWTAQQKHPPTAMMTVGIARTIFYITPIERRKSYSPGMPRGGVKHRLIFMFE